MIDTGNIEEFKEFLRSKGVEVAGVSGDPCECPYANYLNVLNEDVVLAQGRNIAVGTRDPANGIPGSIYFDITSSDRVDIPMEFQNVIDAVDHLEGELRGKDILEII